MYRALGCKMVVGMPFKDQATSDTIYMTQIPPTSDKNGRQALKRLQVLVLCSIYTFRVFTQLLIHSCTLTTHCSKYAFRGNSFTKVFVFVHSLFVHSTRHPCCSHSGVPPLLLQFSRCLPCTPHFPPCCLPSLCTPAIAGRGATLRAVVPRVTAPHANQTDGQAGLLPTAAGLMALMDKVTDKLVDKGDNDLVKDCVQDFVGGLVSKGHQTNQISCC